MISASDKAILRSKMEKYEGKINHMYLDSKGLVTVGVGHLLKDVASAQRLNFQNNSGVFASQDEILIDYEALKKQPKNQVASFYEQYTKLTLSDTDMDALTNTHIDNFGEELVGIFHDFLAYPREVKFALFDIIFNVGATNLNNKWPSFKKAVIANDWIGAAKESHRKPPVSAERNKYVSDLFEQADVNSRLAT